jgi:hypothetical protein
MRHLLGVTAVFAVAATLVVATMLTAERGGAPEASAALSAPGGSALGGGSGGAGMPDLTITGFDFGTTGDPCNPTYVVNVDVENIGDAAAGAFVVDLSGSQQGVGGLAAMSGTTLTFAAMFAGGTATADVNDDVIESNEGNNTLAVPPAPSPTPPPTCTPTNTPTPTDTPEPPTITPTPTPTGFSGQDTDGDGWLGYVDNCPFTYNPGQENNDRNFIDNGPVYMTDDATRAKSDTPGDVCDDDDDNDGLVDIVEMGGPPCATASAATNPMAGDSDGDLVLDGAECALGTNPANPNSKPAPASCGAATDSDSDRLTARVEYCGYNTTDAAMESDSDAGTDGATDGCEAASLNMDRMVNSGDQLLLAQEIMRVPPPPDHANFDINKDGVIGSGDQLIMASYVSPSMQCPNGAADLTVDYMKIELVTGDACYNPPAVLGVRAFVRNVGAGAAGPFYVRINGTDVAVAGLAAGATAGPWTPGYNWPDDESSFADSTFLIAESNESNNGLTGPVPIPTLPVQCTSTPTATPTP